MYAHTVCVKESERERCREKDVVTLNQDWVDGTIISIYGGKKHSPASHPLLKGEYFFLKYSVMPTDAVRRGRGCGRSKLLWLQ